jgi:hypothetical protein
MVLVVVAGVLVGRAVCWRGRGAVGAVHGCGQQHSWVGRGAGRTGHELLSARTQQG